MTQEPLGLQEVPRRRADVEQRELERSFCIALVREVLWPAGEQSWRKRRPTLD